MIDKLKSVWEYYDDHKQFCDCRGQTQSKFKDHLVANKKVQTAADYEESAPVTDVAQPEMNKDTLDAADGWGRSLSKKYFTEHCCDCCDKYVTNLIHVSWIISFM